MFLLCYLDTLFCACSVRIDHFRLEPPSFAQVLQGFSCIHRGFDLLRRHHGRNYDLATVPSEDSAVYDMLCKADSLGVFQVESRAQMSFLPRMKPRNFYDLVIEVAMMAQTPRDCDASRVELARETGAEESGGRRSTFGPILG